MAKYWTCKGCKTWCSCKKCNDDKAPTFCFKSEAKWKEKTEEEFYKEV